VCSSVDPPEEVGGDVVLINLRADGDKIAAGICQAKVFTDCARLLVSSPRERGVGCPQGANEALLSRGSSNLLNKFVSMVLVFCLSGLRGFAGNREWHHL